MRIIQVTPRYFPNVGGVEVVVKKLCETLVRKGIEVTVLSVDRCDGLASVERIDGVVVKRFSPFVNDPLYLPEPRFVAALRDESADVIHVHNIHTLPPLVVAACRHSHSKMVLQPHYHRYGQSPFRQSLFKLYKRGAASVVFSRTHLVMVNSVYEQQVFQEDFPDARHVVLVPEGVDVEDAVRVKHNPVEPKRILYVGGLKRYKNVDRILAGFTFLATREKRRFRLVIVGEGPELNSLLRQANSLGISELIEWKHRLSRQQLLDEYARASVLILLSPLESFSRVVYDALVMGVPVVVLNFGALKHFVASGYAEGVNLLNRESIAEALLQATVKSYNRLSLHSNEFLDWDSYSNRIVELYEKLARS
jgi:1,2-diacylglycerol 3-alpha-glucosyltransferase